MLDGLHRVWRAAELLAGADAGLRDRLRLARAEFLAALDRPGEWPADLLRVARSIERIIRAGGGGDPIDTMGGGMARQVAEDLLSLAADVTAAFHEASRGGGATDPAWASDEATAEAVLDGRG